MRAIGGVRGLGFAAGIAAIVMIEGAISSRTAPAIAVAGAFTFLLSLLFIFVVHIGERYRAKTRGDDH